MFRPIVFPPIQAQPLDIRVRAATSFQCSASGRLFNNNNNGSVFVAPQQKQQNLMRLWTRLLKNPVMQGQLFTKTLDHGSNMYDQLSSDGFLSLENLARYISSIPQSQQGGEALAHSLQALDAITLAPGSAMKLVDLPATSLISMMGSFAQCMSMPDPPLLDSNDMAVELTMLYSMMLNRDVPLSFWDQLQTNADIDNSSQLNSSEKTALKTSIDVLNQHLDPTTYGDALLSHTTAPYTNANLLFRAAYPSAGLGPYLSQFLMLDTKWGNSVFAAKVLLPTLGGPLSIYGAEPHDVASLQNGTPMPARPTVTVVNVLRYPCTLRDLAYMVENDMVCQFGLNAAQLLSSVASVPKNIGWQALPGAHNNVPFVCTSGTPNALALISQASELGLQAAWFFKWAQFMRLRPEESALRLQQVVDSNGATNPYSIPQWLWQNSNALMNLVKASNQPHQVNPSQPSLMLQLVYRVGAPAHPSYPAGHSVVIGASITILKAIYDGNAAWTVVSPSVYQADPTSGAISRSIVSPTPSLTINNELDKLADNIGKGRLIAGIHYEHDHLNGIRLGEQIALELLRNHLWQYPERADLSIPLTLFDGTNIVVTHDSIRKVE